MSSGIHLLGMFGPFSCDYSENSVQPGPFSEIVGLVHARKDGLLRERNLELVNKPKEDQASEPPVKRDVFCVVRDVFRLFAQRISTALGSAWAFVAAIIIILVWGATGPVFHFSDTWQLIINTGTTIVTFLMVFLIQNTQNRDAKAVHLKLDELIRAMEGARNKLVDLEELSDDELQKLEGEFKRVHKLARDSEVRVGTAETKR